MLFAYKQSPDAWVAILGSAIMAMVVCGLTGLIAKLGLRMHSDPAGGGDSQVTTGGLRSDRGRQSVCYNGQKACLENPWFDDAALALAVFCQKPTRRFTVHDCAPKNVCQNGSNSGSRSV